jgi:hypothetical protein
MKTVAHNFGIPLLFAFFCNTLILLCIVDLRHLGVHALSLPSSSASGSISSSYDKAPTESIYYDQSNARDVVDQGCYESSLFWNQFNEMLPEGWLESPSYERFRGFCNNLRDTSKVGETIVLPNGQQLLSQYIFPGLDGHDVNVGGSATVRSPYPADSNASLQQLECSLKTRVAPIAQKELSALLKNQPLISDDTAFAGIETNDGDTWQRAAWYGWQFMSLRSAQWNGMPRTAQALLSVMEPYGGPAHRFVGVARQKAKCVGVEHSEYVSSCTFDNFYSSQWLLRKI